MLSRLRRPAVLLAVPGLLVPALAACGSSSSTQDGCAAAGISGVSFTGDVGKSLSPTWHQAVAKPTSTKVTTLVKGTGGKIAAGDTVSTYLWIGDGTTKKVAYSDYSHGAAESIPDSTQIGAVFESMFKGATYGSRVAAVTDAKELLGSDSAGSQLGIGANDSIVVVADMVKKAPTSPTPSDAKAHDVAPSAMPKVIEKKGKPTGLSWKGVSKPALTTPVQRAILKQGHGATVKASDTVTVNYLGETYQAKSPFDESYTKTSMTQALSGLIPGWSIGLTGVKVGSRVLLQIPPAYGYGAQGSGAIPGNATLWFVVDVVKAQ